MTSYAFEAMTPDGRKVRGQLDASGELAALDEIAQRGMMPLSLTEGGSALPWWRRDISFGGGGAALGQSEVLHFFTTLATMLGARFSLSEALQLAQAQMSRPAARHLIDNLLRAVENGQSLALAMAAARPRFPDRLTALVGAAEASNTLADVSASIAKSLTDEQKLRRDLQGALIYPALLGVMSILVISLLVFYLAPTLMPVFQSSGAVPPLVIRLMAATREFILTNGLLLIVAAAALILVLILARETAGKLLTALFLCLPLIGSYLKQREALQVLSAMRMTLACGEGLLEATRVARTTASAPLFRRFFAEAEERLVAGGTFAASVEGSPLFDPMTRMLLISGEKSNRLAVLLDTACTSLAARTTQRLATMVSILTPLLTLFLGLFVGGIVLSTVSAVLQLNDIAF
ncbi:MAG: type II secretion system F family protein [Deltaproteobacteria bacterium]